MSNSKVVDIKENKLYCLVCGKGKFHEFQTKLNQKFLAMLDWEGFAKLIKAYICKNCGFVHEFLDTKSSI